MSDVEEHVIVKVRCDVCNRHGDVQYPWSATRVACPDCGYLTRAPIVRFRDDPHYTIVLLPLPRDVALRTALTAYAR